MMNREFRTTYIHPTAIVEKSVEIDHSSYVWDNVHIRYNTRIGHNTTIGEKCYIAYDVNIGNFVKINAMVYICTKVTIEDMCMISAGTVFTNDCFPRAANKDLTWLETSEPTNETLSTIVKRGSTIGANATIGPGIKIGPFAMVGMGSVVTKDVPEFSLVVGNPAKVVGYVCICGPKIVDLADTIENPSLCCNRCGRTYSWNGTKLILLYPEVLT